MNKRIKKKKAKQKQFVAIRRNVLFGSGCILSTFGKHHTSEIVWFDRKECGDLVKEVWHDKEVYEEKNGKWEEVTAYDC